MATITIGANDYDALDTQANVTAYLAGSITDQAAAYAAATDENQKKSIIEATRILQRQKWTSTDDVDDAIADADETSVPQKIQDAMAELAAFIANGELDFITNPTTEQTVKSVQAGSAKVENWKRVGAGANGYRFPLNVWELVKDYLSGQSATNNLSFSSGVSRDNEFSTGYGIIDGL